ncbi:MAG: sigma-54-dependent transcriptional regulator [Planctomycetota bacterium]
MKPRILVVDDETAICNIVAALLEDRSYEAVTCGSAEEAEKCLSDATFDLVITDLALPGKSGLDLLTVIKAAYPRLQVIMMTAYATVKTAVEAMKLGAFHYVTKPFDNDELMVNVQRSLEMGSLAHRVERLEGALREKHQFRSLIGSSSAWATVIDQLDKLSRVEGPVLITGESGTGKEKAAQAIHYSSPRQKGPFEAVNCGAVPATLVESTFFGHKKGAFTDAREDRQGCFERAHKGTLFLDEVTEMPLEAQVKLLRVLQEGEVVPVGGSKPVKVDVRVLAATNRDLEKEVAEGRFRQDLYFRLNVLGLDMPPLRKRQGDVSLFMDHFAAQVNAKEKLGVTGFSPEVRRLCESYPWPGNVRELENFVYRMMVTAQGRRVEESDLPDRMKTATAVEFEKGSWGSGDLASLVAQAVEKLEKELIRQRLEMFDGAKAQTAEALGISRKTLFNKMKQYGMEA